MRCASCHSVLPETAEFCPSCGAPSAVTDKEGNVGGAYVGGSVQAGGDFIGRDQVVHGNQVRDRQYGLSGQEIAQLFQAVYQRIDERPADPNVEKEELRDTVRRVQDEAAKGDKASSDKVSRWLRTVADLAPDVFNITVAALTNPVAGVAAAIGSVAERIKSGLD